MRGEEQPFYIDAEDRIIKLLTDLAKMSILCNARIRENDIEPAFLPCDLFEETIQVAEIPPSALHLVFNHYKTVRSLIIVSLLASMPSEIARIPPRLLERHQK